MPRVRLPPPMDRPALRRAGWAATSPGSPRRRRPSSSETGRRGWPSTVRSTMFTPARSCPILDRPLRGVSGGSRICRPIRAGRDRDRLRTGVASPFGRVRRAPVDRAGSRAVRAPVGSELWLGPSSGWVRAPAERIPWTTAAMRRSGTRQTRERCPVPGHLAENDAGCMVHLAGDRARLVGAGAPGWPRERCAVPCRLVPVSLCTASGSLRGGECDA